MNNKIILITGASSGIGKETARIFAKEGAIVLLLARNVDNLRALQAEINDMGGQAFVYPVDLTEIESVKQVTEKIKKEHGVPDVLINNAGSGKWKFADETDYEEVHQYMAVPYYSAFYMTRAFLPEMLKADKGHIVNMTSYAGFIPFAGATAYIVARKAIIGFHEALAADLHRTNIKVSLAYFAKVQSTYWENNPGSEEKLPGAQVLIPVISPGRAARAVFKGVQKRRSHIYTPFILFFFNLFIRHCPVLSRWLIYSTGYKRNQNNP